MSTRVIRLSTLQETRWSSIFNESQKRSSLVFSGAYFYELRLTHQALRPLPETDPEAQGRTWDASPLIPYYYATDIMAQELMRLSQGVPKTELVPITAVGGAGDSVSARTPVQDVWLQVVLLPTDWLDRDQRELEVRWIVGKQKHIKDRYRHEETPRTLGGQMPADHWGNWRLDSHKLLFAASGPFTVRVVRCSCVAHVQDEHGVATCDPSQTWRTVIVGQLNSGIVLWWKYLWRDEEESAITQQGDCVIVGGAPVHIFTGEGSDEGPF